MDYFFGHDIRLTNKIDWFFNSNHAFLAIIVVLAIIALYFALWAKTAKGQKITKLVLATTLFLLEIGRISWSLQGHLQNGGTVNNFGWWWEISFQMCAIMNWTTMITLVVSAFVKSDNRVAQILKNICLGCALVGGVLTFTYPDCITGDIPILNFKNIQTILVHTLLIFVPIYFIKIKEITVRLKNIWMPALGYLYVGCLSMCMSIISGHNFAFALKTGLLEDVGIKVAFPWHLPVTLLFVGAITVAIYGFGELFYYLKNRKNNLVKEKRTPTDKTLYYIGITLYTLSGIIGFFMLMFISQAIWNPTTQPKTMLGLLCLIPFIVTVVMLALGDYYYKKSFKKVKE